MKRVNLNDKNFLVSASALAMVVVGLATLHTGSVVDDEKAYSTTAIIKGHVTILNHPTLGKTAGSSTYLVFQRVDCPKATMGVMTDLG